MRKIKDIKNIDTSKLKHRCKLDNWYAEMVEKSESELTVNDLYHMLVQKVFLEIAVPKCWMELKKNPLVGENYEGQFLEKIIRVLKENEQYINNEDYNEFMESVRNYPFEFEDDSEKEDYENLLEQLSLLFK